MLLDLVKQMKTGFILLMILSVLTGFIYPGLIVMAARGLFPWQADGSLLLKDGQIVGSQWIGQSFTDAHYFWGRPSATQPFPYNSEQSTGSNLSLSNPVFIKNIIERTQALQKYPYPKEGLIPIDLVTASGSGLDPDISPLAAYYQIPRVAQARHLKEAELKALVDEILIPPTLKWLGGARVNVLQLNQLLDERYPRTQKS